MSWTKYMKKILTLIVMCDFTNSEIERCIAKILNHNIITMITDNFSSDYN